MKWPLDLLKHTSEGTPYKDKEEEISGETGDETFDVNKWASALLSMKPWEEEGIANGTFGVVKLASALLSIKPWANGGSPTRRLDEEEEMADGILRLQSRSASQSGCMLAEWWWLTGCGSVVWRPPKKMPHEIKSLGRSLSRCTLVSRRSH